MNNNETTESPTHVVQETDPSCCRGVWRAYWVETLLMEEVQVSFDPADELPLWNLHLLLHIRDTCSQTAHAEAVLHQTQLSTPLLTTQHACRGMRAYHNLAAEDQAERDCGLDVALLCRVLHDLAQPERQHMSA